MSEIVFMDKGRCRCCLGRGGIGVRGASAIFSIPYGGEAEAGCAARRRAASSYGLVVALPINRAIPNPNDLCSAFMPGLVESPWLSSDLSVTRRLPRVWLATWLLKSLSAPILRTCENGFEC